MSVGFTVKKRITIADVARHAGVSPASVSKVLNNRPNVSPKTRLAVLRSIEELGYRPNSQAQRLASGSSNTVALLIPNLSNPFFGALAHTFCTLSTEFRKDILVFDFKESQELEDYGLELVQSNKVDGVFLAGGHYVSLSEKLLRTMSQMSHLILVNGHVPGLNLYSVRTNDVHDGWKAADYLLRKGHRRFWVLAGPMDRYPAVSKMKGFRDRLAEEGLNPDDILVLQGGFTAKLAYEACREQLRQDRANLPDAIFAMNDLMALGALRALNEAGVSVPGDVAVMGYDDIELSEYSVPPLTTLRVPIKEMALLAFDLFNRLIHGESPRQKEYILETQLIVRESC